MRSGLLWALLGALSVAPIASAQSNYLVPVPALGAAASGFLNDNGDVGVPTGVYSSNQFTPFPADFSGAIFAPSGAVIGSSVSTGHLELYSSGVVTDLGLPAGQQSAAASGVNASGEIAGTLWDGVVYTGFVYSNGKFNLIGPLNILGTNGSLAYGINDSDVVVGCTALLPAYGDFEADVLQGGVLTDLGLGCATSLNDNGQFTGWLGNTSSGAIHAFITVNGTPQALTEPPQFDSSMGWQINSHGQIVGVLSGSNVAQSAFFYDGTVIEINDLVSTADPLYGQVHLDRILALNGNRLLLVSGTLTSAARNTYLLQAPWLDVAPGALTFATEAVGTTSPPQSVTLTNSGSIPLPIDSISVAAPFSETNSCPAALVAGANCVVSVSYSPTAPGDSNALLVMTTAGARVRVPLAATGGITVALSASPTSPVPAQAFTVSWTATAGSSCQSTGGSQNDGWSGGGSSAPPRPSSGSTQVIEAVAGVYTYGLTCTAGSVSADASLKVTIQNMAPVGGGGGGGALDLWILSTAGLLLLARRRLSSAGA